MLIEQRLMWIDKIENHLSSDADIISFGSESCITPFLDINDHWIAFIGLFDIGKRVKIVTPRITQNELTDTVNLLRKIITLHRTVDIVVNDWGLLQFCSEYSDYLNIHIGRQLCRSLLDCPWYQEILENESIDVRDIIASHPYKNIERIKMLQVRGMKGLELNALFQSFDFQPIIDLNIEIAAHCDTYLLTCGPTCLVKRIIPNKACQVICEENFQLKPSGKWLNYFENQEPFSDYEKSMINGLSLSGKKVTLPQKVGIDGILSCGVNVLITTPNNTIRKGES